MSKNKNGFLSESDMQNVKDKIIEKTIDSAIKELLPGIIEKRRQELIQKGKIVLEQGAGSKVPSPTADRMERIRAIISRYCPEMTMLQKTELAVAIDHEIQ